MITASDKLNEGLAAIAFDKQAPIFDDLYSPDLIIQYKRERVREHVERFIQPASSILELNAGTGEDAIYFANKGHYVHATDISAGMLDKLKRKVKEQKAEENITIEECSFTELIQLKKKGPYDYLFSNFAGLNCTNQLEKVLASFSFLVKPGGFVTLVMLPKFCLWEFLLLIKGKFRTAFRRFAGKKGARAHIEGEYFRCWYYNPSFIKRILKKGFETMSIEGLCSIVPPSYMEDFGLKYPGLFQFLKKKENKWKSKWPWKVIGDYYIITLKRKT
ncbi:MAG: methyltransferase domain-containing protein [Chitinophagaceae bacterium]